MKKIIHYSVPEVAKMLSLPVKNIQYYIDNSHIAKIRKGTEDYVLESDFIDFRDKHFNNEK